MRVMWPASELVPMRAVGPAAPFDVKPDTGCDVRGGGIGLHKAIDLAVAIRLVRQQLVVALAHEIANGLDRLEALVDHRLRQHGRSGAPEPGASRCTNGLDQVSARCRERHRASGDPARQRHRAAKRGRSVLESHGSRSRARSNCRFQRDRLADQARVQR